MALGSRVKAEREALGLTQTQLAERVGDGLSQQAVDRLEKRDSATSQWVVGIADALQVSLRWLISGKGDKAASDWPFHRVSRSRWDACNSDDRAYVQGAISRALDECEAQRVASSREKQQAKAA